MHAPPQAVAERKADRARGGLRERIAERATADWAFIAITVLGVATAFFRLGAKGLWGDEVWEVSWAHQQPLVQTFLRFRAPPDLSLQFLLVQISTSFNRDPFFVRLPSAVLGAATVAVLFLLGRRMVGSRTAFLAAAFLAVAPYHVWYSQDARPYAGLALYSLLSLYFLCSVIERPTIWAAAGLALATTLNLYNQLFALFPILVEIGAVAVWTAATVRQTSPASTERSRLWDSLSVICISFAAACAACSPLYPGITGYIFAPTASSGTLSLPFLQVLITDVFTLFAAGSGWAGILTTALFALGTGIGLYRRQWFIGLALAWIAVPILLLWLSRPQHMFVPRYFLFMQPILWLVIAYAIVQVSSLAAGALRRSSRRSITPFRYLVPGALALAVLVAAVPPAWYSYSVEKTNDWSALCGYLERHLRPGDAVTGNLWSTGVMQQYCLDPGFYPRTATDIAVEPEGNWPLAQLTHSGRNVWYIDLGPGTEPAYIATHYRRVPQAAWGQAGLVAAGFYDNRLLYPQAEPSAVLYHHTMRHAPAMVQLHDTKGSAVSKTWPDYAAIGPGGSYLLHLGLPASGARVLRISYLGGFQYNVLVNGRLLATFDDAGQSGQWLTRDFALPRSVGTTFLLRVTHVGPGIGAISLAEVRYG